MRYRLKNVANFLPAISEPATMPVSPSKVEVSLSSSPFFFSLLLLSERFNISIRGLAAPQFQVVR